MDEKDKKDKKDLTTPGTSPTDPTPPTEETPEMKSVIEVRISCELCGLTDLKVYVDERTEEQNLEFWMNKVFLPKIAAAHHMIHPDCKPQKLSEVKIPASSKGVGFKPTGTEDFGGEK